MNKPAHITTGIRKILEYSQVYEIWQSLFGNHQAKIRYVRDFIKPEANQKVLDIGCGTGHILNYLPPNMEYTGYDLNTNYIETAKKRYGHKGKFYNNRVSDHPDQNADYYDIVLANALLHHLTDEEASEVFRTAYQALKPGGYLVTHDGVYEEGQHWMARWFLSKDRGQNVRTKAAYLSIAHLHFDIVEATVLHDFYRFPYTVLILKCTKKGS